MCSYGGGAESLAVSDNEFLMQAAVPIQLKGEVCTFVFLAGHASAGTCAGAGAAPAM